MLKMSDEKYKQAARFIVKAGGTPFPITDTLINILKLIITEGELDLIMGFKRKSSQTIEQLMKSSKLSEDEILSKVESLAKKGVIFNQPSSSGIMVYRLLPLVNVGIFEYTFMKKLEFSDKEKQLAKLFEDLFKEVQGSIQDTYDITIDFLKSLPPVDRTIPFYENVSTGKDIEIKINESIEVPKESIVPAQKIEGIVKKFEHIAVAHCFCRHHKDILGEPCKQTDERENCFTFGKSAKHVVQQGFGRFISQNEAIKIMKEAENSGLLHKAYHPNFDITKDETSICNCCKCCCGNSIESQIAPISNSTNFLSDINQDICVGCGTCVDKCPLNAIKLNADNKAERMEEICIGCGICAHYCPEAAISLLEGRRTVFIPPPRLN